MGWPQRGPRKNLTSCPGLVDHYIMRISGSSRKLPLHSNWADSFDAPALVLPHLLFGNDAHLHTSTLLHFYTSTLLHFYTSTLLHFPQIRQTSPQTRQSLPSLASNTSSHQSRLLSCRSCNLRTPCSQHLQEEAATNIPLAPSARLASWLFVSDASGIGQMTDVGRKTLYISFNKLVRVYVVTTRETTFHRFP